MLLYGELKTNYSSARVRLLFCSYYLPRDVFLLYTHVSLGISGTIAEVALIAYLPCLFAFICLLVSTAFPPSRLKGVTGVTLAITTRNI